MESLDESFNFQKDLVGGFMTLIGNTPISETVKRRHSARLC